MKRKIILFLLVTCFIGAATIPAVQADDNDYITNGQILSMLQASLGSIETYYHNGGFHAAHSLGDEGGRIVPYWPVAWYRYQDAHMIQLGFYFELETHDEAQWFYNNLDVAYYLQGPNDIDFVELPVIKTALSCRMISDWGILPYEGTGWRVAFGSPFHQKELDIGAHTLYTEVYLFGQLALPILSTFYIVEV